MNAHKKKPESVTVSRDELLQVLETKKVDLQVYYEKRFKAGSRHRDLFLDVVEKLADKVSSVINKRFDSGINTTEKLGELCKSLDTCFQEAHATVIQSGCRGRLIKNASALLKKARSEAREFLAEKIALNGLGNSLVSEPEMTTDFQKVAFELLEKKAAQRNPKTELEVLWIEAEDIRERIEKGSEAIMLPEFTPEDQKAFQDQLQMARDSIVGLAEKKDAVDYQAKIEDLNQQLEVLKKEIAEADVYFEEILPQVFGEDLLERCGYGELIKKDPEIAELVLQAEEGLQIARDCAAKSPKEISPEILTAMRETLDSFSQVLGMVEPAIENNTREKVPANQKPQQGHEEEVVKAETVESVDEDQVVKFFPEVDTEGEEVVEEEVDAESFEVNFEGEPILLTRLQAEALYVLTNFRQNGTPYHGRGASTVLALTKKLFYPNFIGRRGDLKKDDFEKELEEISETNKRTKAPTWAQKENSSQALIRWTAAVEGTKNRREKIFAPTKRGRTFSKLLESNYPDHFQGKERFPELEAVLELPKYR